MAGAKITLVLSSPGGKIPLSSFSNAIRNLQNLLVEIDRSSSEGGAPNTWAVTDLRMSSPAHVGIEPLDIREGLDPAKSVQLALAGFQSLNNSSARPQGFSDHALRKARTLARIKDIKNIDDIRLMNGQVAVTFTGHITANVDELIGSPPKESIGGIQGRLDVINVHSGLEIGIYRKPDNLYVKAVFQEEDEKLRESVKGFLGKPVLVFGTIRRAKDGAPKTIRIVEIGSAPAASTLESIFGLDSDFTGGLDPNNFVRERRDD